MLLNSLKGAIDYLEHKGTKGRIKNAESEKIKIQYFRALVYAIDTYAKILKDVEIQELKEDIEEIRRNKKCQK